MSVLRRNGACKDRIFGFLKCLFVSQSFYLNGGIKGNSRKDGIPPCCFTCLRYDTKQLL